MNKTSRAWSLSAKLTAAYSILILIVSITLTLGMYFQLRAAQRRAVRDRVEDIVRLTSPLVDGDWHAAILSSQDEEGSSYRAIFLRLRSIQDSNVMIKRMYTVRGRPDGSIMFVVDTEPNPDRHAHVGEAYSRSSPSLQQCLLGAVKLKVEDELYTNPFGDVLLSGCAPIRDQYGRLNGVLGIDLDASSVAASERQSMLIAFVAFLLAAPLSMVAGWVAARRMTSPVIDLVKGTTRVAQGWLDQPVPVSSRDELGVLAETFNTMQLSLIQSRLQLEEYTRTLEQRTSEVERRAMQITTGAEIARVATTLLDRDQLIDQIVHLIQERFNFYYVGLFLADADNRYAVLQCGTGAGSAREAGRIMKEHGHRLEIGGQSMVGWTCANKKARIALSVGAEPVRFANPLLPDTRSEMALPLRVGERVIGALDVQSTQAAAFDEGDIAALQSMTDQVAVALENAHLFQQTQATLKELEATNRLLVRGGWQEYLVRGSETSRRIELAAGAPGPETLPNLLTVPLELRGQSLGQLTVRREANRPWSDEEAQVVQAIALQTALAADNARLIEQTQQALDETRALYETSREITAAGEMSQVLSAVLNNLARTSVHAAAVALFDTPTYEQATQIELAGAWDHLGTPRIAPGVRFAIASFPLFDRITGEEPLVSGDLLADPGIDEPAKQLLGGLGFRAMAITPLVARGQWIGLLFVMVEHPRPFTTSELDFHRALADQAAVAIDSRRLFAETQRRAQREALIRQITTRIRAASDIQGILETTAAELANSMGVSRAIVRLTTGDGAQEA